jgi:hypothetical protein
VEYLNGESTARNGKARSLAVEVGKLDGKKAEKRSIMENTITLTFSAFMVAEVTISFKSRRLDKTKELCVKWYIQGTAKQTSWLTLPQQAH